MLALLSISLYPILYVLVYYFECTMYQRKHMLIIFLWEYIYDIEMAAVEYWNLYFKQVSNISIADHRRRQHKIIVTKKQFISHKCALWQRLYIYMAGFVCVLYCTIIRRFYGCCIEIYPMGIQWTYIEYTMDATIWECVYRWSIRQYVTKHPFWHNDGDIYICIFKFHNLWSGDHTLLIYGKMESL